MRKLVVFMTLSVDGFMEGPDRDISWHMVDEEVHTAVNQYLKTAGAFLQGRVTHELMAYVAERVAPHERVRQLEFIDEVPKSPSGKLLRRVLVQREREQAALGKPLPGT